MSTIFRNISLVLISSMWRDRARIRRMLGTVSHSIAISTRSEYIRQVVDRSRPSGKRELSSFHRLNMSEILLVAETPYIE